MWLVFLRELRKRNRTFLRKGRAAALTDCTERKNVFLTFYKCRFSIKWSDNHGLYGSAPTFRKFLSHLRQAAILNELKIFKVKGKEDGFTGALNPHKPDCIRLRLDTVRFLIPNLLLQDQNYSLYYNGFGHRALAVRRLHTLRSVLAAKGCGVLLLPSFSSL